MSPLNSALLNGSFIQGFELDDVHVDAPWHANSVILPALFAAAELWQQEQPSTTKISGASFLLSTIVGFEIGSRVGRALHGSEMLSRGWHSVRFSSVILPSTWANKSLFRELFLDRPRLQQQFRSFWISPPGKLKMHSEQLAHKHAVS